MNDENQNVNQNDLQTTQNETTVVPEPSFGPVEPTISVDTTSVPVEPAISVDTTSVPVEPTMPVEPAIPVEPTIQTENVVPSEPVMTNTVETPANGEKPKKGKLALIIIIAVIVLIIGYLCFNIFVRLTGSKNVENAVSGLFTSISDVLKSDNATEATSAVISGDVKVSANNQEIALDYELGVDTKNIIMYLAANAKQNNESLINLIGYLKDNNLYFTLDGNKIYYTAADLGLTEEDINLDTEELATVVDVFSEGAIKSIDDNKITKSFDGLSIKTEYVLDDETFSKLILNGLKEVKANKDAVKTLENYGIAETYLDTIIEGLNEDSYEENEEIGKLIIYNNIITGAITKVTFGDEDEVLEFVFGSKNEINYYDGKDKLFTITYNDDEFTFNFDYNEKEDTTTTTITCDITSKIDGKKTTTTGKAELKIEDTEYTELNLAYTLTLNNVSEIDGKIGTLDTTKAVDIENMTEEDMNTLSEILSPIITYVTSLFGESEIDYSDEDYDYYIDDDLTEVEEVIE